MLLVSCPAAHQHFFMQWSMCKSGTRTDSWQTTSRAHENLSAQVASPQGPFDSAASRVASLLAAYAGQGFSMIRIAKRDVLFLILCSNLLILAVPHSTDQFLSFQTPSTSSTSIPIDDATPPQRQALLVFCDDRTCRWYCTVLCIKFPISKAQ